MKYFFAMLLIAKISFAQRMIEGIVTDSNHAPLQYVAVGIVGTSFGSVSDLQGHFRFSFQDSTSIDSIRFSMVGFTSKIFSLKDFIEEYSSAPVILNRDPVVLKEVEVHPPTHTTKILGNKNTNANLKVNFSIPDQDNRNLGSQIGRKFHIAKPTTIQKVSFYLSSNDYDTVVFRINIYSVQHNLPSQLIVKESIIRQVHAREKNWIEVELPDDEIAVNGDVIVTLEWIGASKVGTMLSIPITFPSIGATHYYKFGSQNHWKVFSNMSSCMTLQVSEIDFTGSVMCFRK